MTKRIKIRKKRNKTGQHTNNHWNGYSTDKEGSQLEVSRAEWSPGLLAGNFSSINEKNATQMDYMINNGTDIPKWMATGTTILCQKDPRKGNAMYNYRPISYLPLMWKPLTEIIANSVYECLEMHNFFLAEQKGCRRNSRGTKDQLLIDKMVLNDCKKRHTNLGMA